MEKTIERIKPKTIYIKPDLIVTNIQLEMNILQASGELPDMNPVIW